MFDPAACPQPDLSAALSALLRRIPRGAVTTFGELARTLGDVRAALWISDELSRHACEADCACHRVVAKDGRLPTRDEDRHEAAVRRLTDEGFAVHDGCVDLADRAVPSASLASLSDGLPPFVRLQQYQHALARRIVLRDWPAVPRTIAAVDVSYAKSESSSHFGEAVAAYVVCDARSGDVVWSTTYRRAVRFPYVTGYLGFRELPLLLGVLEQARAAGRLVAPLLVDGQGVLHPRGAGVASQLGVLTGLPTIGLGKTHLCGTVDLADLPARTPRDILVDGRPVGAALRNGPANSPVFVSPGHGLDRAAAVRCTLAAFAGHRLPEPQHLADRLGRDALSPCRTTGRNAGATEE